MITQKDLEEIIKKRSDALNYAITHFEELKQCADKAEIIKYGTSNYGIGALTPKVARVWCKGEYGKFLKAAPNKHDYTIYELTVRKKPLRIRHFMSEPCYAVNSETLYFLNLKTICGLLHFSVKARMFISAEIVIFLYMKMSC